MLLAHAALGVAASGAIAGVALRRGSLARSGAAAALVVGTAIFAGGGPAWFAALVVFFVTSTLLGRVGRARKEATKREFSKGDTRDAWQVLANGGVAALAALGMLAAPAPGWAAAFLGALATANGDTWATELGVLSRGEPFSLARLGRVPRGTSGAVSPLGLLATIGGAAAIGLVAAATPNSFAIVGAAPPAFAIVGAAPPAFAIVGAAPPVFAIVGAAWRALVVATVAGTLGALADSLLGALVQETFYCAPCGRETEREQHTCGRRAERLRGVRGFGNDAVNAAATLAGALAAVALAALL